jgi:hypothetical protein
MAVPYSTEYQGELAIAASHLRAAAKATSQPTFEGVSRSPGGRFRFQRSTTTAM